MHSETNYAPNSPTLFVLLNTNSNNLLVEI